MNQNGKFVWAVTLVLVGAGATMTACADRQSATAASVRPEAMPEGESWAGVYYHPVFGYLHLVEHEGMVRGKWRRTDQSAWGELTGKANGNVVHFTWKEKVYGRYDPSAVTRGRGYFVYKLPPGGIAELDGQYGLDDNETGSDWHNVKQQRKEPDLDSIKGDPGGMTPNVTGKWQ